MVLNFAFRFAQMFSLSLSLVPGLAGRSPSAASTPVFTSLAKDHRILLIYSSLSSNARQQQLRELAGHGEEARDRDLVIVAIPGPAPSPLFHTLPSEEESASRQRFKVAPSEFAMVLVGKDGGEKHRWSTPAPFEAVRALIDDMPMRKEEMQSKASKSLHR